MVSNPSVLEAYIEAAPSTVHSVDGLWVNVVYSSVFSGYLWEGVTSSTVMVKLLF